MKEGIYFIALFVPVALIITLLVFIDFWFPALKNKIKCTTCRTHYPVSWIEPCTKCKYYWLECNGVKNHTALCNKHLDQWHNIQNLEIELFPEPTEQEIKEKGLKALLKKLKN